MKELEVRYSKFEEKDILEKFLRDPTSNRWILAKTDKEIEIAAYNWINFAQYKASLTGFLNNKIVAFATLFLMPYKKLSHQCMFYIVVDKDHRNMGIGTDMLKNIINLAKNYFKIECLICEVFDGCPVISLLKKEKFNEFAHQKKYIKDNGKYSGRILFELWMK